MSSSSIILALKPIGDRAEAVVAHADNQHLVHNHRDELMLAIGRYRSVSGKRHVLAVLGRSQSVDIAIPYSFIATEQCSLELDSQEKVIMLQDRSRLRTTQVSGGNATPLESGRDRCVVLHKDFNNRIRMGSSPRTSVEFKIVWFRHPFQALSNSTPLLPLSEPLDAPRVARTVDDRPTEEPSRRMTRFHTPGQGLRIRHYKLEDGFLGRGQFGAVHKTINLDSGVLMAVKLIPTASAGERERLTIKREVEALSTVQHPHIVNIFGTHQSEGEIEIFMGLKDGNLSTLSRVHLPNFDVVHVTMFRQMLQALDCLNSYGIIHRDVKPENILYTRDPDDRYTFQLGDFGLCNTAQHATTRSGTPYYMAPEVHRGQKQSTKADVWSLFVTFLWMRDAGGFRDAQSQCVSYEQIVRSIQTIARTDRNAICICEMALEDPSQRASAADMLRKHYNGEGLHNPRRPSSFPGPAGRAAIETKPSPKSGLVGSLKASKGAVAALLEGASEIPSTFGVRWSPPGPAKAAEVGGLVQEPASRPRAANKRARPPEPPARVVVPRRAPTQDPLRRGAPVPRVDNPIPRRESPPHSPQTRAPAPRPMTMPGGFPEG